MASVTLHESEQALSVETKEVHRAIVSVMEELEAIDWYQQRIDVTTDSSLKEILTHNRNEEIEHASMLLEWIRRNRPEFDERMEMYLFTKENVIEIEEKEEAEDQPKKDLGIGRIMKGE